MSSSEPRYRLLTSCEIGVMLCLGASSSQAVDGAANLPSFASCPPRLQPLRGEATAFSSQPDSWRTLSLFTLFSPIRGPKDGANLKNRT
jgi:hypothetical protein